MKKYFLVLIACSALFLTSCQNAVSSADNTAIDSVKKDGKYYADKLPMVKSRKINDYINNITKKLIKVTPKDKKSVAIPINIYIQNFGEDTNAFTIGGYVFLERSVISKASTEGGIAGIIAHELAHNYLGHIIKTSGYEWCEDLWKKCVDWHHQVSRQDELDADALAVHLLVNAGYDPEDLAQDFLKLAQEYNKVGATSFPSHPSLFERAKRIRELAKTLMVSKNPTRNPKQLKAIQAELKKIKPAKPNLILL